MATISLTGALTAGSGTSSIAVEVRTNTLPTRTTTCRAVARRRQKWGPLRRSIVLPATRYDSPKRGAEAYPGFGPPAGLRGRRGRTDRDARPAVPGFERRLLRARA